MRNFRATLYIGQPILKSNYFQGIDKNIWDEAVQNWLVSGAIKYKGKIFFIQISVYDYINLDLE